MLTNKIPHGSDWDQVWAQTRSKKMHQHWIQKKLTVFAVSNIMNLPKETVRRKIENLKKKKFIHHSNKEGLLTTEKIEEIMKPFATKELHTLAKFLQALDNNKSLNEILSL